MPIPSPKDGKRKILSFQQQKYTKVSSEEGMEGIVGVGGGGGFDVIVNSVVENESDGDCSF